MSYRNLKLLFGDIHCHSNYSTCGVCKGRNLRNRDCYLHTSVIRDYSEIRDPEESIDLLYYRAKNELALDFVALTDHDFTMSNDMWNFLKEKASEWYFPGIFTTLQAYEWTSCAYGHRNVYFLDDDPPIFRCVDYGSSPALERGRTPQDLWREIEKAGVKAITIPHHPSLTQFPVDWSFFNGKFDRLVELVSIWGIFEHYNNPFHCITSDNMPRFFAIDALERGYNLGFVGGGDSHDCYPGSRFRSVIVKNSGYSMINSLSTGYVEYFFSNPLGAGMTGVYATENSRESIFKALYSRRAYALVGAKIKLRFTVNDRLMGEELFLEALDEPINIRAEAEGEGRIDRLEVVKNGKAIQRVFGTSDKVSTEFIDEEEPTRLKNYYYVRVVQRDGARAWSSPIWVSYRKMGGVVPTVHYSGVYLENKALLTFKGIRVVFLREFPLIETQKPLGIKSLKKGVFAWVEKTNNVYDLLLKLRFKSSENPANFRGFLDLRGIEDYRVEPVGFAITKYGGDLFKDNYNGLVEWDITPSSNLNRLDSNEVKGLDVGVRLKLVEDAYAIVDVFIEGKRPLGKAFLGSKPVKEIPFKVQFCNASDGCILEVGNLKVGERVLLPSPSGKWRFLAVYPATVDEKGLRWSLKELK